MSRLSGKVALVSGGASGMGVAHARAVVKNGGKVVIGDIDEGGREVAARLGGSAAFCRLDVTDLAAWRDAVDFAVRHFGKLDVLVNNAGRVAVGRLADYTEEQWHTDLAVNLTGTFLGVKAAAPALIAAAPSSIVNISSVDGLVGGPYHYGYVAAKHGVRGLTKAFAVELSPKGVRVNSVHPGVIATPMTRNLGAGETEPHGLVGRMGRPEEIANLVVFLASDESGYCTGSEFVADGGQMLMIPRPPGIPQD